MIAYAGMSKSLPNLCYYNNDEYTFSKPYSEHTAELIDEEVKRQINEQYERAKKILLEHKEGHERLAQLLIDREVIYAEDVENIFGKRPWISRTEEILAANEQSASMEDDSMNHANENAEIIRNKAIEAVLEKAKEKQNMSSESVDNGTADNKESQNLKKGPQPFHELKVTNSNPVEDAITSEVSNEISEDINIEKTDNEIPENNSESADSYKNYEDNKTNDNEVLEYKEIANTESSNNDETSVDNIDISDKGNNSSKANKNDEVKKKNLTNLQ